MMRLSYFRTLRLIAELGSMSKAADQLMISQPAVSLEIRRLEEELGCKLFNRERNRVHLNDRGQVALKYAYQLEQVYADLLKELREAPERFVQLSIGGHPSTCRSVLPPVLSRFHELWPTVKVQILGLTPQQVVARVLRGDLDLGFAVAQNVSRDLVFEPVQTERLWLIAPRSHPMLHGQEVSPARIAAEPMILLDSKTQSHVLMKKWAIGHGAELNVTMEVSSEDLLLDSVRMGYGIGVVGEGAMIDAYRAGDVAVIRTPGMPLHRTSYALFSSWSALSAPARSLLDLLLEVHRREHREDAQPSDSPHGSLVSTEITDQSEVQEA